MRMEASQAAAVVRCAVAGPLHAGGPQGGSGAWWTSAPSRRSVSNLLEPVEGEPVVVRWPLRRRRVRSELVHMPARPSLASQAGTDKVAVFGGELLDMERMVWRMRKALGQPRRRWLDRLGKRSCRGAAEFEPFTGVDCSQLLFGDGRVPAAECGGGAGAVCGRSSAARFRAWAALFLWSTRGAGMSHGGV